MAKKRDINLFKQKIQTAQKEIDIQEAWRELLVRHFNGTKQKQMPDVELSSEYTTDGYITRDSFVQNIRLLLEFKDTYDFKDINDLVKVIAQVLYYLNFFKEDNRILPKSILIANRTQAVVIFARSLYKYIGADAEQSNNNYKDIRFGKDASKAGNNKVLTEYLKEDNNIKGLIVVDYQQRGVEEVLGELDEFIRSDYQDSMKIPINIDNIKSLFELFVENVLKDDLSSLFGETLTSEQKKLRESIVGIFMQLIQANPDYYLHPNKKDTLVTPSQEIRVHTDKLQVFLSHYDRNLTTREIKKLDSIADHLIEDTTRREHGDFWTPSYLAKRADEIMQEVIASDYKETSIIWDPAAGSSNLTRDFTYSDLYVSTYHQWEIDLGRKYNPEAKAKFQYDFLNDDLNVSAALFDDMYLYKMPKSLYDSLTEASQTGKRVIFYTNPPYGRAGNMSTHGSKTHKVGIAKNTVNELMKKDKLGLASAELYIQFMYRATKIVEEFNLTNVYIAFFTPDTYLNSSSYEAFNKYFFKQFEYVRGHLYSVGNFSGTAGNWAVTFSVHKLRDVEEELARLETETIVEEFNDRYEIDKQYLRKNKAVKKEGTLTNWIKGNIDVEEDCHYTYPAIERVYYKTTPGKGVKLLKDSIGYLHNSSNDIARSVQYVWLYNGVPKDNRGSNVLPSCFNEAVVTYSSRRSVVPNHTWYTDSMQFMVPDTALGTYKDFVNDCLVYSLVDNKSLQASYRNYGYTNCGINDRWINNWFWATKEQLQDVIDNTQGCIEVSRDMLPNETNRFVSNEIQNRIFTEKAQKVLNLLTELYINTLKYRDEAHQEYPEFSFNAWDIGFVQLEKLVRLYEPKNTIYLELKKAIEELRKQVEEGVYTHGMLTKVVQIGNDE